MITGTTGAIARRLVCIRCLMKVRRSSRFVRVSVVLNQPLVHAHHSGPATNRCDTSKLLQQATAPGRNQRAVAVETAPVDDESKKSGKDTRLPCSNSNVPC
jgi:hypothetical protein